MNARQTQHENNILSSPWGLPPWADAKLFYLFCICLVFILYVQVWLCTHCILFDFFNSLTTLYSGKGGACIQSRCAWGACIDCIEISKDAKRVLSSTKSTEMTNLKFGRKTITFVLEDNTSEIDLSIF